MEALTTFKIKLCQMWFMPWMSLMLLLRRLTQEPMNTRARPGGMREAIKYGARACERLSVLDYSIQTELTEF